MTPEPGREALAAIVAGEPVAWIHPSAGWTNKSYDAVRVHCRNDGPMPEPLYSAAQLAKVEKERDEAREQMAIMQTQHALEITDMADNFRAVNVERVLALMPADVPALIARATTAEARAEAAEERVAVLEEALKPFNDAADEIEEKYGADLPDWQIQFPELTMKDFRRARNALKRETQNADQ